MLARILFFSALAGVAAGRLQSRMLNGTNPKPTVDTSTPPPGVPKLTEYDMDASPISCTDNAQCGNGMCSPKVTISGTKNYCVCKKEYATPAGYAAAAGGDTGAPAAQGSSLVCSYPRKSHITAICLTFFLGGFGSGGWYMGWTMWGGILIGLCALSCVIGCIRGVLNKNAGDGEKHPAAQLLGCISSLISITVFGICIANMIWMDSANCVDSNGVRCIQ